MGERAPEACGGSCGITRERERQRESARSLARRVLSGDAREGGWSDDDVAALASTLSAALPCRALLIEGDRARWIYLSATVDDATWVGLREGRGDAPEGPQTALRVGLSAFGRLATLQEVSVDGAREGDGWWIEESRRVGVDDPRLRAFVKVAQGALRSAKAAVLDVVFLGEPCGEGGETVWEALFDADPMGTRTGVCVPTVGAGHVTAG